MKFSLSQTVRIPGGPGVLETIARVEATKESITAGATYFVDGAWRLESDLAPMDPADVRGVNTAARPAPALTPAQMGWRPMETAPKNGTLVQLLIKGGEHPTINETTWSTAGFNNLDEDGEDKWTFAGWCWDNDHFTDASEGDDVGEVIGWAPFTPLPETADEAKDETDTPPAPPIDNAAAMSAAVSVADGPAAPAPAPAPATGDVNEAARDAAGDAAALAEHAEEKQAIDEAEKGSADDFQPQAPLGGRVGSEVDVVGSATDSDADDPLK